MSIENLRTPRVAIQTHYDEEYKNENPNPENINAVAYCETNVWSCDCPHSANILSNDVTMVPATNTFGQQSNPLLILNVNPTSTIRTPTFWEYPRSLPYERI